MKSETRLYPDVAIPPGEHLADVLRELKDEPERALSPHAGRPAGCRGGPKGSPEAWQVRRNPDNAAAHDVAEPPAAFPGATERDSLGRLTIAPDEERLGIFETGAPQDESAAW